MIVYTKYIVVPGGTLIDTRWIVIALSVDYLPVIVMIATLYQEIVISAPLDSSWTHLNSV